MRRREIKTVVLVEDEEVDVMMFKRALQQLGIDIDLRVYTDGVAVLEALRSDELPLRGLLMVVDLNMPRMSGLELVGKLREDPALRHLPVVMLTTSDHDRDRTAAYDSMVAGYIVKPLDYASYKNNIARMADYWAMVEAP